MGMFKTINRHRRDAENEAIMNRASIGRETNSLHNSYEFYFGARRGRATVAAMSSLEALCKRRQKARQQCEQIELFNQDKKGKSA